MKRFIKNNILGIIIGLSIAGIVVYAETLIGANEITYTPSNNNFNVSTVEGALNTLYNMANTTVNFSDESIKMCKLKEGTALTVGSKYECTLGDKDENNNYVKRNFYLMSNNTNNTVDLISEKNISEDVILNTAKEYFSTGAGSVYTSAWKNVIDIDLPNAETIAQIVGNTSWTVSNGNGFCLGLKDKLSCLQENETYATEEAKEAVKPYTWLFNYTGGCLAFGCDYEEGTSSGYWTKSQYGSTAYSIFKAGFLDTNSRPNETYRGVRPVITILKNSLY